MEIWNMDPVLLEDAIKDFTKALELDPNFLLALYNRGETYRITKQYDKAILDYNKITQLTPNKYNAYLKLGMIYYARKQYDKAIENYTHVIHLSPKPMQTLTLNLRGAIFYEKKDYISASNDADRAAKLGDNKLLKLLINEGVYVEKKKRIN